MNRPLPLKGTGHTANKPYADTEQTPKRGEKKVGRKRRREGEEWRVEEDGNKYLHFKLLSGEVGAQLVSHQALQDADSGGGTDHVHDTTPLRPPAFGQAGVLARVHLVAQHVPARSTPQGAQVQSSPAEHAGPQSQCRSRRRSSPHMHLAWHTTIPLLRLLLLRQPLTITPGEGMHQRQRLLVFSLFCFAVNNLYVDVSLSFKEVFAPLLANMPHKNRRLSYCLGNFL